MRKILPGFLLSAILLLPAYVHASVEAQAVIEDAKLITAVESALLSDDELKASKINVQAAPNGNVVLTGSVGSENQKIEATHTVKHVTGVTHIDNQLQVAP